MRCPFCHEDNDKVIDSRSIDQGSTTRRRRECLTCKRRYTTYERVEEPVLKVIKKDGSRVPFERDKIKRGLERACWKRPISAQQIESIVAALENDISQEFESEVNSDYLGELVMNHLKDLDEVALVRFASVYREFTTIDDFLEEMDPMIKRRNLD